MECRVCRSGSSREAAMPRQGCPSPGRKWKETMKEGMKDRKWKWNGEEQMGKWNGMEQESGINVGGRKVSAVPEAWTGKEPRKGTPPPSSLPNAPSSHPFRLCLRKVRRSPDAYPARGTWLLARPVLDNHACTLIGTRFGAESARPRHLFPALAGACRPVPGSEASQAGILPDAGALWG